MLNKTIIENYLNANINSNILKHINLYLLESTSSTNDFFKGKPKPERPNMLEFCFTEKQTQGRGRLGRAWHSSVGENLLFSCRWIIPDNISDLNGLSLCISLALINALKKGFPEEKLLLSELRAKWPNDLYYQDKKLAGILIELQTEKCELLNKSRLSEVIIGVGLNVNMSSQDTIEKPWTSLKNIIGHPQDRDYLAALFIQSLHEYMTRFVEKNFIDFQQEWQQYDYLKGKEMTLLKGEEQISGIACGINLSGHLLIETAEGNVVSCLAGEVSTYTE